MQKPFPTIVSLGKKRRSKAIAAAVFLEVSHYRAFQGRLRGYFAQTSSKCPITMLISTVIVSKQWFAFGRQFLVITLVLSNDAANHYWSVPRKKIHGKNMCFSDDLKTRLHWLNFDQF